MKIKTHYTEENELIIINKINDNVLKIKLANKDTNNINFIYTYHVYVNDNDFTLECIYKNEIINNQIDGWNQLRCCLLETHFNEVINLIIKNYKKEEWVKNLIKIFTEIPFYKIDDTYEQSGLLWIEKSIIDNWNE